MFGIDGGPTICRICVVWLLTERCVFGPSEVAVRRDAGSHHDTGESVNIEFSEGLGALLVANLFNVVQGRVLKLLPQQQQELIAESFSTTENA